MTESFATLHANRQEHLPTMAGLSEPVSAKDKTEAALLSLGFNETTTSVPRSTLVRLIEAESGFLFPEVADRVQAQIARGLELQLQIAVIEAELSNRIVSSNLYDSDEEIDAEPWSYIEDVLEEWPPNYSEDRSWRELIILTSAEKQLSKELRQQEARLVEFERELHRLRIAQEAASIGIAEIITIESEEGVA